MSDILAFLPKALALLNALVAGGIVKSSSGIVIANLLADVQAVVKGVQNPTPDLVTEVGNLLNDLKVNGVLQGAFIDSLDVDMQQFVTFSKAISSAQAGIGPTETLLGVKGSWVFIPETMVDKPLGL